MDGNMLIAVFSLAGTAIGTVGGILAANKLTNFRLKSLEEKVDKHNCLVERMVKVEESTKSAHLRLNEIIAKD